MALAPGWTTTGTQMITGVSWNFDTQASLSPDQLTVRVTSGACGDDPAQTLVWESTLQRAQTTGIGVDVYTGELTPLGLAVSSGGSGHARLTRPVTLNPTSQIDLTLFQLSLAQVSTPLTVCFRA